MNVPSDEKRPLPGADLSIQKMPGHWLLARFGKRVLRPGGLELTRRLLGGLEIQSDDDVVELAPGLGVTAQEILARRPQSYRGVERNEEAAAMARDSVGERGEIVVGNAESTGLSDGSASVVIGEAMLTMQSLFHKEAIVKEAMRLLRPGGRYGVHEIAVVGSGDPKEMEKEIASALSSSIHVGARPLSEASWREVFEKSGFVDVKVEYAPMHLLEARRMIADEGLGRAVMIAGRILLNPDARSRVLDMRRTFRKFGQSMQAIAITARKP